MNEINTRAEFIAFNEKDIVDLRKTFAIGRTMTSNPYVQEDLKKMRKEYGVE